MQKSLVSLLLAASLAVIAIDSTAGVGGGPSPSVSPNSESDNQVYLGLLWYIGGSHIPQVELGYRNVKVDRHGDVKGGALSMTYYPGMGFDMLKLKGVKGGRSAQGELGVGYSIQHGAFLGTLGVQGNHITGGLDYLFGVGPKVYGGINTIGKYHKSNNCPSGTNYNEATGQCDMVGGM